MIVGEYGLTDAVSTGLNRRGRKRGPGDPERCPNRKEELSHAESSVSQLTSLKEGKSTTKLAIRRHTPAGGSLLE